jgi:hypothetical protein
MNTAEEGKVKVQVSKKIDSISDRRDGMHRCVLGQEIRVSVSAKERLPKDSRVDWNK